MPKKGSKKPAALAVTFAADGQMLMVVTAEHAIRDFGAQIGATMSLHPNAKKQHIAQTLLEVAQALTDEKDWAHYAIGVAIQAIETSDTPMGVMLKENPDWPF